jgi:hypothetical protein
MRQARHVTHGPRRPWTRPWRLICQCGLAAWPCPVVILRKSQAVQPPANERPVWNGATAALPNTTFRLTPGQLSRGQGNRR